MTNLYSHCIDIELSFTKLTVIDLNIHAYMKGIIFTALEQQQNGGLSMELGFPGYCIYLYIFWIHANGMISHRRAAFTSR